MIYAQTAEKFGTVGSLANSKQTVIGMFDQSITLDTNWSKMTN